MTKILHKSLGWGCTTHGPIAPAHRIDERSDQYDVSALHLSNGWRTTWLPHQKIKSDREASRQPIVSGGAA
jgi:hypothetical protein